MNPQYLIDGYNLIHLVADLNRFLDSGLEPARNLLITLLRRYAATHQVFITVVFDGEAVGQLDASISNFHRLTVIYSRPPEKADPVIKRIIDKTENRRGLTLVSADHELIHYARRSGVQTLSPQQFYDRLRQPANQQQMDQKFNSELSQTELADWLKLFGAPDK